VRQLAGAGGLIWFKLSIMKTILTESAKIAARVIREGGLSAFPTETVYGLGADVFDEQAVEKIFIAKGRPPDNPLIAHIGSVDQINVLAARVPPAAQRLISAFFPAALTLVLEKTEAVPLIATANLQTIGIRMPNHRLAQEFLEDCGTPVAAPSANLSGRPSPTTWQAVLEDLDGRIDCILQGEMALLGLESTVVDCTSGVPLILRPGAVSLEMLQTVVRETRPYRAANPDETPRSPGLKHKHYSPRATVVVGFRENSIDRLASAFIGITQPDEPYDFVLVCASAEDYAHRVFDFFRECDHKGVKTIFCEPVEEIGVGAALMDRLARASQ
jgi:L-threonylcarbamoyladenylate synthase